MIDGEPSLDHARNENGSELPLACFKNIQKRDCVAPAVRIAQRGKRENGFDAAPKLIETNSHTAGARNRGESDSFLPSRDCESSGKLSDLVPFRAFG